MMMNRVCADYANRGGVVLGAFIWMKGEDSSSCGAMGKVDCETAELVVLGRLPRLT
jgi:hypothetical protein